MLSFGMFLARDLKSRAALFAKGLLFVFLGCLSSLLLLLEHFSWRHFALLLLAIWSFCRAYYFAFYVIEKYVDGQFRYAGLFDLRTEQVIGPAPDENDDDSE